MRLGGDLGRWLLAGLVAVGAHAAVAALLLKDDAEAVAGAPSGAFVVELAAVPVARPDVAATVAPGPDQVEAAASPASAPAPDAEKTPAPPENRPEPQPDLPPPPPLPEIAAEAHLPKNEPQQEAAPAAPQTPQAPAPITSATQAVSDQLAERAAAPQIAPPSKIVSETMPNWQVKLTTALERGKRYPARAQARREEGVVHVSFVIDRQGRLLSSRVQQSSGHALLDAEALALLERAQPFPAPPAELKGPQVTITVPVRFFLR